MSIEAVLARIQEIESAFSPRPQQTSTTSPTAFSSLLQQAGSPGAVGAPGAIAAAGGSVGQRIIQIASGEVGQTEQPPGSNDSPRIAQYRNATVGATAGAPWCAYFVSWVARQAGVPLGDQGQGFGAVDDIWQWAQRTGRAVAQGQRPQPGDLAVFNEHIGIVESVLPDGRIQTIEGNHSDSVGRAVHAPGDAIGYVRLA